MKKAFTVVAALYTILLLGWMGPNLLAQSNQGQPKTAPPPAPFENVADDMEIPEGYVLVGDAVLPEALVNGGVSAQGLIGIFYWPGGVVPYIFDANVTSTNRNYMVQGMAAWESVANVDFVPRTSQSDYVRITNCNGNSSFVGRIGGSQQLCMFNYDIQSIVIHELGHALGLYHEHTRPDRDSYVIINTQNITAGAADQFTINQFPSINVGPYDFESIMHYNRFTFSDNGQPTIVPRPGYEQYTFTLGTATFPTPGDIQAVQAMYGGDANTAPSNDTAQTSEAIRANPFSTTLFPAQATADIAMPCVTTTDDTVWYRFTAPGNGTLSVNTINSNYDTVLAGWSGTPGSLTPSACNDDISFGVRQSSISMAMGVGETRYIQVGTFVFTNSAPSTGQLVLNATFTLQGDINNDGMVTPADAVEVINDINTTNPSTDVDGSGTVNQTDANLVINNIGRTDQP